MRVRVWQRDAVRAPGAPVVLVHGLGVSSAYMPPLARELVHRHDVFAVDLLGHGRSDDPGRVLSAVEHAQVVEDVLRELVGDARVIAVGHSWGCQVTLELCHRHPERVCAGVLLAPAVDQRIDSLASQAVRLASLGVRQELRLSLIEAREYLRTGMRRTWHEFRSSQDDDPLTLARSIDAPLLVARGEHDPLVSPEWVEMFAEAAQRSATATYARAAHVVNWAPAGEVAASIEHFVDQFDVDAPSEPTHLRHGKLPAGSVRSTG